MAGKSKAKKKVVEHSRAKRLGASALGVAAAAGLAVGVNMLVDRAAPDARIDLTTQRLYTLAGGTRQVLAGLKDPITLRLYYSRRLGASLPAYGAHADRVRELLAEYVAASAGKLRLEVLDPEPFSEIEDRAVAAGLQGVPVDQTGEKVYFGLAASNLVDDERVVAFFQPERERFLEYDLTRLVWELSNPRRPVVGVMSSLPLAGDPRSMMLRQAPPSAQGPVALQQMRQFFTVKEVPLDAQTIDPDVQVLMVAHPQGLSENAQYAIDQFVMRGGKLLLLVDPHSESQANRPSFGGPTPSGTASSLDRLLNAWGVDAPSDKVVLDLRGAWRVRAAPGDRVQAVDYAAWFNLPGDGLNRDEVALAGLDQVTLAAAGEVRKRDGAPIEFVPLLTSSPQSMVVDAARVRERPDPARLLSEYATDGQKRVLAARVRGRLDSAFPSGPPAPPKGEARPEGFPAHLARTDGAANIVVANDSDLLEDRFWVRVQDFFGQQVATPFSGNGSLVVNLLDALSGSDALISLRSRGAASHPFTLMEEFRAGADAKYRQSERGLQERLERTEAKLKELRAGAAPASSQGSAPAAAPASPEQRAEIDAARDEIQRTRRELRGVQLDLRRDMERLERVLRFANIAFVPMALVALALAFAVLRARRRAAAAA